jgi:hypothetical protein
MEGVLYVYHGIAWTACWSRIEEGLEALRCVSTHGVDARPTMADPQCVCGHDQGQERGCEGGVGLT